MLEDKVHETSWNIRKHHLNQLSYSVVPTVVPVKTPRFPTGKSTSKIIQVCPASKGFAKHTQHAHFFPQNARCVVWSKQFHLVLALHLEHQSGDKRSKNSWRQTLKLRVPVSANALQQLRLATYFGLSAEHLSAPHLRCLVWSLIKHAAGRPKWCQAKINIQYNSNWSLPKWFQHALLKPDQTIYISIYTHTQSLHPWIIGITKSFELVHWGHVNVASRWLQNLLRIVRNTVETSVTAQDRTEPFVSSRKRPSCVKIYQRSDPQRV